MIERLSDFVWVVVRVDCPLCPHRKGQYRLARLVENFGADIQLCELLNRIAFDCPRNPYRGSSLQTSMIPGVRLGSPTWRQPAALPDLPPMMRKLTVILGGKG
jgi:hypothetical protein